MLSDDETQGRSRWGQKVIAIWRWDSEKLSSETAFEVNGDREFLGLPLTSE
jgi:hypothetical protein